jgi:hypothetical protein
VPRNTTCANFFGVTSVFRPADALPTAAPLANATGGVKAPVPWSEGWARLAAAAADRMPDFVPVTAVSLTLTKTAATLASRNSMRTATGSAMQPKLGLRCAPPAT